VSGRRLFSRSIAGSPARRRERLDLPVGIAPGVYLVRVTQGAASRVQRFALFN